MKKTKINFMSKEEIDLMKNPTNKIEKKYVEYLKELNIYSNNYYKNTINIKNIKENLSTFLNMLIMKNIFLLDEESKIFKIEYKNLKNELKILIEENKKINSNLEYYYKLIENNNSIENTIKKNLIFINEKNIFNSIKFEIYQLANEIKNKEECKNLLENIDLLDSYFNKDFYSNSINEKRLKAKLDYLISNNFEDKDFYIIKNIFKN